MAKHDLYLVNIFWTFDLASSDCWYLCFKKFYAKQVQAFICNCRDNMKFEEPGRKLLRSSVVDILDKQKIDPKNFMDIGCGAGSLSKFLI